MKKFKFAVFIIATTLFAAPPSSATGGGASAGMALLRNSGARSSSLGDAFVSMADDITAMDFNPASLATLDSGHISLQYERGAFDDSFGKAMVGTRRGPKGALGLSLGYYNSGNAVLFDGVNSGRSVIAEQDRVASLGYGFSRQRLALGVSVKYLWSDLAEKYSNSAESADLGLQYQLARRFRIGAAGPLVQSKLRYAQTSEKLPKIYRAGIGWTGAVPLATGNLPLQLLFDVPYDANTHLSAFAFGAETQLGILALRLGFNTLADAQQFSMGAGFQFQRMNFDYAFGMVATGNVDSVHKVTVSYRLGPSASAADPYVSAPAGPKTESDRVIFEIKQDPMVQLYQVKDGETLESIAASRYGSSSSWNDIFQLNRYMYSSPDQIKPGCKIFLPARKGS